ncbi:hypothetical protein [Pyrobaculum sp.]
MRTVLITTADTLYRTSPAASTGSPPSLISTLPTSGASFTALKTSAST